MKYLLIASAVLVSTLTSVNAASICKGLTQTTCQSAKIEEVSVCRWQSEYYTTSGKRGNYCTTSNKKLTPQQYEKLQKAITDGTLIASTPN